MAARGVFPGSFNPPTVAHLAIARRAVEQFALERLDLAVSRRALAKETVEHPRFEHRIEVLERFVERFDWLEIRITSAQLLVDIARGYDVLVVGADKWWQIQQLEWYESESHRREALAALPRTAVIPRSGYPSPPDRALALPDETLAQVSSTRAREGETDLMVPEARAFAEATGAWIDPEAYERRFGIPTEDVSERE